MIKDGLWHNVILLLTVVLLHVFLRRVIKLGSRFLRFLRSRVIESVVTGICPHVHKTGNGIRRKSASWIS